MKSKRHLLPLVALAACAPAVATAPLRTAPILPEVNRHMEQARSCMLKGTFEVAAAHASMVLVGDRIRVHVAFENVPADRWKSCERILDEAFEGWETLLDDSLRFIRVNKTTEADVLIRFKPSVQMKREEVAGYANWKRTIKVEDARVLEQSYKADLQLRTSTLRGTPMPSGALRHAALHELGHILGLDDSPRQGDIMGPLDLDYPVSCPLAHEVSAVKAIREEATQIREQAKLTARKL